VESAPDAARATPAATRRTAPARAGAARDHPATATQRRLWLIDRAADADARRGCLVPTILEFTGPAGVSVDAEALRAAASLVLDRHPALRSRFGLDAAGRWLSYRTDGPPPPVTLSHLRGRDVEQAVRAVCSTPFDLATDAPARAEVIAAGDRTVLALCAHQIVLDQWSRQLLTTQIGEAYRAVSQHRMPRLAGAAHPADVLPPTRAVPEPAGLVEALLAGLRGAPIDVRLPHDRPRPRGRPSVGGTRTGSLGPELTERLRAVADQHDCTTLVTMSALLAVALADHGDQRDFLFGFDWLGRQRVESWHAVGVFTDTLLLRVDLTGRPTWRELLDRVRASWLASSAGAGVPFDDLVGALEPGLPGRVVAPVVVNVHGGPFRLPSLHPRIRCRELEAQPRYVANELALDVTESADDMRLALHYPLEPFDPATIAGLGVRLRRCAADLVTDPDGAVVARPGPGYSAAAVRAPVTACRPGHAGGRGLADNPAVGELGAPARLARRRPCRRWASGWPGWFGWDD
jgi:hypothetical protein